MNPLQRLSKQELARSQLEVALRFYIGGEEFPAVITLAGAAEEILGKIAAAQGFEPALKRTLRELVEGHKRLWGREVDEREFAPLRNHAKNELKHSAGDVTLDLEHEAALLLARALENYHLCTGNPHPSQYAFTSLRVENWRAKQTPV
jgi:hypothetical protein